MFLDACVLILANKISKIANIFWQLLMVIIVSPDFHEVCYKLLNESLAWKFVCEVYLL